MSAHGTPPRSTPAAAGSTAGTTAAGSTLQRRVTPGRPKRAHAPPAALAAASHAAQLPAPAPSPSTTSGAPLFAPGITTASVSGGNGGLAPAFSQSHQWNLPPPPDAGGHQRSLPLPHAPSRAPYTYEYGSTSPTGGSSDGDAWFSPVFAAVRSTASAVRHAVRDVRRGDYAALDARMKAGARGLPSMARRISHTAASLARAAATSAQRAHVVRGLAALGAWLGCGVAFYSWHNGWSLADALFYSVAVGLCIGYQVPGLEEPDNVSRLFTTTYMVVGTAFVHSVMLMCATLLIEALHRRRDPGWRGWHTLHRRKLLRYYAVLCCAAWVLVGTAFGVLWERWSVVESAQFAVTSIATAGLQSPSRRPSSLLFTSVFSLTGVPLFVLATSYASRFLVEKPAEGRADAVLSSQLGDGLVTPAEAASMPYSTFLERALIGLDLVDGATLEVIRRHHRRMRAVRGADGGEDGTSAGGVGGGSSNGGGGGGGGGGGASPHDGHRLPAPPFVTGDTWEPLADLVPSRSALQRVTGSLAGLARPLGLGGRKKVH